MFTSSGRHYRSPELFYGDEPVPFHPRFIVYDDETNCFVSNPHSTTYYIPNMFDMFMSTPNAGGAPHRWFSHNLAGWQTDWYFHSLLREYEPDPFGLES